MLDTYSESQYDVDMTTTYHSQTYYTVRSVVRFIFWGSVVFLAMFGFARMVDSAHARNLSRCPVELNRDFTWQSENGARVSIANCRHPRGVVLNQNGTWDWEVTE